MLYNEKYELLEKNPIDFFKHLLDFKNDLNINISNLNNFINQDETDIIFNEHTFTDINEMIDIIDRIKNNKIDNNLNKANIITFKYIIDNIVKNDVNILKQNNINTNNYNKIIEF